MNEQQDHRIFNFIIRTAWLHFEDALDDWKNQIVCRDVSAGGRERRKRQRFHYSRRAYLSADLE